MKLTANGIQIHVRDQGQGPLALVFLHHWGGSSRTFGLVTAELEGRYRTVALDHRGWGDSEAPASGYGLAEMADDAQGVIAALGLQRFVLVGHSMGGKVAQLLASRRPAGLIGLLLVAPSPPPPVVFPDEMREAMLHVYDSAASVKAALDQMLTAAPLPPELEKQSIEDALRGAPQAKRTWPTATILEDIRAAVPAIEVPTLVLAGEHDRVDAPAMLERELMPLLASARLEVVPGTGHLSPLEVPKAIAERIVAFVDGLPAAAQAAGA